MSVDLRDREVEHRFRRALKSAQRQFYATSILANRQHKVVGRVASIGEDRKRVAQLIQPFRLAKQAAVVPDFQFRDGMLYTAVRAISARINQNWDAWPSEELAKSYKTFLGKPCFVNHANFDPDRARGRVVAARYIENGKDKYVQVIQEIDALRFPKLAHEIRTGGLDSVSMGVEAGFTICSYCGNRATDVFDMCDHVKFHKGQHLPDPRTGEPQLVYENCYRLGFFELSYVFDPADETAVVSQVIVAGKRSEAGKFVKREGARPIDPSKEVYVHYNRHAFNRQRRTKQPQADLWSVRQPDKQTGKHVRGYIDDLHLRNARLHVQPGGSQLYKDTFNEETGEGDRTVHAGIYGTLDKGPAPEGMPMSIVGYNPEHDTTFIHKDTGEPVYEADHVHVDPSGKVYAYKADGWGRQQTAAIPRLRPVRGPKVHSPRPRPESEQKRSEEDKDREERTRAARRKQAWGEQEAPEDIDTLRDDDDDSADDYEFVTPYRPREEDMPFQNSIESPEELQTPDFDETKRLDRTQEEQGLDSARLVEDVGEVGAPSQEGQQAPEAQPRAARKTRRKTMARTRTRYAAEDDEDDRRPPWLQADEGAPEDEGGEEDFGGGEPPGEFGGADEFEGGGVEDIVDDIEEDVDRLKDELGDEDEEDEGPLPPTPTETQGPPPQFAARRRRQSSRRTAGDDEDDDSDDDEDDDKDKDDNKPPWLKDKESARRPARRPVKSASSGNKKRKGTQKGAQTVGAPRLSERGRVATAGRRQHRRTADDSGHTDGGPYGDNTLGEQAETYIPSVYGEGDGVPPAESVAAPTGDEPKESNTENNLVARIQAKSRSLQADIDTYNRMTREGRRRTAEGVEQPTVVNPELSGTDDQSVRGDDFQDVGLSPTETQPKDASRHWFSQFNNWLTQVTGQQWNQHSAGTLTRAAARWSKGAGVPLDALFPTLQTALRHAQKVEAGSNTMRRQADEKLEVAAPDDRVDVEKPVSDETDADAQASQFDLGDFANNAGDSEADPEMSVDSQIWAPGEGAAAAGGSSRESSREIFADGLTALRCAEAYIRCGLAPYQARFKLASWLQTIRHSTVEDRANLLDAVYQANARAFAAARVPAGSTRGAQRGTVPPGFGSGRRVASTERESALDPKFDAMMWLG